MQATVTVQVVKWQIKLLWCWNRSYWLRTVTSLVYHHTYLPPTLHTKSIIAWQHVIIIVEGSTRHYLKLWEVITLNYTGLSKVLLQFHPSYFKFLLFWTETQFCWICLSVIYYWFKLLLFQTILCFSRGFKIVGFNSITSTCTFKPISFWGLFLEGPERFLNPESCSKDLKPYDYRAVP